MEFRVFLHVGLENKAVPAFLDDDPALIIEVALEDEKRPDGQIHASHAPISINQLLNFHFHILDSDEHPIGSFFREQKELDFLMQLVISEFQVFLQLVVADKENGEVALEVPSKVLYGHPLRVL